MLLKIWNGLLLATIAAGVCATLSTMLCSVGSINLSFTNRAFIVRKSHFFIFNPISVSDRHLKGQFSWDTHNSPVFNVDEQIFGSFCWLFLIRFNRFGLWSIGINKFDAGIMHLHSWNWINDSGHASRRLRFLTGASRWELVRTDVRQVRFPERSIGRQQCLLFFLLLLLHSAVKVPRVLTLVYYRPGFLVDRCMLNFHRSTTRHLVTSVDTETFLPVRTIRGDLAFINLPLWLLFLGIVKEIILCVPSLTFRITLIDIFLFFILFCASSIHFRWLKVSLTIWRTRIRALFRFHASNSR